MVGLRQPSAADNGRSLRVYGLTALAVALAVALNVEGSIFAGQAGYLPFVACVVLASAFGGFLPGVIVVGLGAIAVPVLSGLGGMSGGVALVVYIAVGFGIAFWGGSALKARRTAATTQQHLQSILDTVPDAMIVIDRNGIMRSFSTAAERLFGWSASEVIGRNVSTLMPQPYRDAHNSYLERYARTKERRIIGIGRIIVGLRKNGTTFPMELHVGETGGAVPFFTGFVRDLTERQQVEARLQDLQSELVHVSRLMAVGEMASMLAHELNQPLSAVANLLTGSRRLLERGRAEDEPKIRDALQKAAQQALRAGDIIHRMRSFVSRGDGERSIENLSKVVEEAAALGLVGAKERHVEVGFDLDVEANAIFVDKVQIQQVLLNLIRNAMEAMQDTPRRKLSIATARRDDEFVVVSVADTGSGLAEEIREKLFQPFMTTKPQGMGVGLSISRSIVDAHGGRIWAEANAGGGTVFRFTLPPVPTEGATDD
ncbi:PAS domain-containing sensor histidine kinase [Zavarzinia aquatilis]|uniref:Sensor protein FixL n=1 Tax=Zavarzinia aquatilis TaxID=2211142 RepID=A0A317EDL2_9PROT|nr:PAS domain-containing sensor histidine kinase [Zavarzinia aquatilis]